VPTVYAEFGCLRRLGGAGGLIQCCQRSSWRDEPDSSKTPLQTVDLCLPDSRILCVDLVGDHSAALRSGTNHQDLPQGPLYSNVAYLVEGEVEKWGLRLSQNPGLVNQDEPSVGKIEHAIPRDRLLDRGVATQEDGLVGPEQLDVLQRQRSLSGDEKEFVVLGSFCLTSWSGGTNGRADSHLHQQSGSRRVLLSCMSG
jgi:hypothetical protein